MSDKGAAITKFRKKIEDLEKSTGCVFEISYPGLEEAIEKNRLYADWFEPGTILVQAAKGNNVVTYDITGELDARIDSASGEPMRTFAGKFKPVNEGGLVIESDDDLMSLSDGSHMSGCRLSFAGNNHLRISVNSKDVLPVIAKDPSVARGILNKDCLIDLLNAAGDFIVRDEDRLPDGEIAAAMKEREEGKVYELGSELPDSFLDPPETDEQAAPVEEEIPEYDDYVKMKDGEKDTGRTKEALEKAMEEIDSSDVDAPKKETKKPAKKAASKTEAKKGAKTAKNDSGKETESFDGRFDLLPLDLVGDLIDMFDKTEGGDLFKDIEAYKKSEKKMLDVAASFAKERYPACSTDSVMALAKAFEKDAAANGEDSWKEKDARAYLNDAIKAYLMFLREGCSEESDHILEVLFALFCGAWASENGGK